MAVAGVGHESCGFRSADPSRAGVSLDRRRFELQIRTILVTYRGEKRRRDSETMREFRERALTILSGLEAEVAENAELAEVLAEARRELAETDPNDLPD